jgi:hypothetical protein
MALLRKDDVAHHITQTSNHLAKQRATAVPCAARKTKNRFYKQVL